MVSALYKACSEGNLQAVQDLLNDVNAADIEAQDESGCTALIEAVKLGHVEIVRILLDKGADPSHASPNGPPELFTTEQPILDLLAQAKNAQLSAATPSTEVTYVHDGHDDSQKAYYPLPPPEVYPYYPAMNPPMSAEGAMFYPPPPPHPGMDGSHSPGGMNNLPPPEIARFIPCRYFPACRYGPSCIFAHPPQGYYPPGGPPPAQYPPFDPAPPYPPTYYPPPAFQQPNSPHPMVPLSPPPAPHMVHGRSPSEVVSPTQGPFNPGGVPIPVPYGPMSPSGYPHPSQMPVPISLHHLPPLHHQPQLPPPPHSPANYVTSPATPFVQDGTGMYPPAPPMPNGNVSYSSEADAVPKPHLNEGYAGAPPMHRDGPGHGRRGGRRNSFNGRKPACLFFPTGRCKNGDDCRFPHVMPDANGAPAHVPYYAGRGGGPRQPRGHAPPTANSSTGLEEKLNQLNVTDENSAHQPAPTTQQATVNGAEGSKSSSTSDNGQGQTNGNAAPSNARSRFPQGGKHHGYNHHHNHHGKNQKQSLHVPSKQRVPGDDEFPVLGGAVTPPSRSPLNTNGPTAAQILQAPAPKKESAAVTPATVHTREASPVCTPSSPSEAKESSNVESVNNSAPSELPVKKLPISFAAVATAAGTPDVSKEVSVSA